MVKPKRLKCESSHIFQQSVGKHASKQSFNIKTIQNGKPRKSDFDEWNIFLILILTL